MAGKGDKRRPGAAAYISNYDRIFGVKEDEIDASDVEPFHIRNARELQEKELALQEKKRQERKKKLEDLLNEDD
tara:strand:+ start:311 stop:532 length:222 start_codon:yes stop_codon:yes gene_type:complete